MFTFGLNRKKIEIRWIHLSKQFQVTYLLIHSYLSSILMKLSKNEEINEDIDAPAEIDAPANPIPEETPGMCYVMSPDMSHLNECR